MVMQMPEYIEREALLQDISETVIFTVQDGVSLPTTEMRGANKVINQIRAATAADVVEVVRCKDCHYWDEAKVNKRGFLICPVSGMDITPNDFCSYGERKKVSLEDIVDIDAQTKANNEAMRKVIDFIAGERKDNEG